MEKMIALKKEVIADMEKLRKCSSNENEFYRKTIMKFRRCRR
jgi:hypothetical protein